MVLRWGCTSLTFHRAHFDWVNLHSLILHSLALSLHSAHFDWVNLHSLILGLVIRAHRNGVHICSLNLLTSTTHKHTINANWINPFIHVTYCSKINTSGFNFFVAAGSHRIVANGINADRIDSYNIGRLG